MRMPSRLLVFLTILSSLLAIGAARAEDTPPQAAGSEKRIALVIGNAAYEAGALATPANDAGLIAQTLQAAGFDVVGARDLDEASLRGALRDFTDKATDSGPDTVAFIYLSGYGLQFNGENYFAPIDAKIGSAADVPARAVRISDFKRQLAGIPLKARFVVLDAARTSPFAKTGDPLAGGLALAEADPGSLIAFNAAPGTVGPEEKGPYGAYAQALVEMIRDGGLPPNQLFDRVRLRVSETTQGAEVPWNVTKLDTSFVFFQRAADAPPLASRDEVAALDTRPIRELGAKDAYTASLKRDTLQGYQDFVDAYPKDVTAKRVRALIAARRESITWRRSAVVDTPDAYWSYLSRYPRGPHAWDARRRLRELSVAFEPPPRFAALAYDVPPPPPEEYVYVDRPVVYFGDPVYDFAPPPPPPLVYLPPRPVYIVDLPPPPPVYDVYALPVPAFVPVPAYVSAPAYIAPPPNNVYYQNIHNVTVINEINERNVAYSRDPDRYNHDHGFGGDRGHDGPSIGAIGAGAIAGAALGAAATRVALPPALARKAALQGNPQAGGIGGPSPLRPGFGSGQPGQGLPPNGAPQAGSPGWQGQPGRPGFGQPLPGQNGQALPQQATRPGSGAAPVIGPNGQPLPVQAGRPGLTTPSAVGPNGQTLPAQAARPGLNTAPIIGPNGQPLPAQANRPGLPGQPAQIGLPGNPRAGQNGQTPPIQANRQDPGNQPAGAPNGNTLPQQATRPGLPGQGGQPGLLPQAGRPGLQPALQANRPSIPTMPGQGPQTANPTAKAVLPPVRTGADPAARLGARPDPTAMPSAGRAPPVPGWGGRNGPGAPQGAYQANPSMGAPASRQPAFDAQRQQIIQAQQRQQAAQQQAMQRQQMMQQQAQQQAMQRQQMMQQQAAQQQAMQRQQMMQQQAQQQAMQRQQMMQQQAMQQRAQPAMRQQPSGGGGGCRPGLPCR